ncbi:hypothetical protein FisN_7Lh141 [Fistulifera solaris]|uniref:Uncharacterized protein n=1 Tax=Fistulifera solaris TaxID=1519565 RepID=A0A1Z5JCN1_FISSO|nr:hypothetical protein FisN_7Lh141 [Fistulifera solaris]|eukprot:GAX11760.1 hypothetical protein FisN_7Lh141 [Fistulifera solaris]
MTEISLNSRSTESAPISPTASGQSDIPFLNLKKRSNKNDSKRVVLASVNSAFLDGLFADVAQAQGDSFSDESNSFCFDECDTRSDPSKSFKKTRLSKTKSMTRCGKSYLQLNMPEASTVSSEFDSMFSSTVSPYAAQRSDSLEFQLSCVSESSCDNVAARNTAISTTAKLAFPRLLSVSTCANSSSTLLPRKVSDLQSLVTEDSSPKESYGWFVEMDDDHYNNSSDLYKASTGTLAFSAPTAPKAANFDAEVEWAKAADTVDDVLGDFF